MSRVTTPTPHSSLHFDPVDEAACRVWHESLAPLFSVEPNADEPVTADFQAFHLGEVMLLRLRSGGRFTLHGRRADQEPSPLLCQLVQAGAVSGCNGEAHFALQRGDIAFSDLAQPLQLDLDATEALLLLIPRDGLFGLPGEEDSLAGRVVAAERGTAQVLASQLRACWAALECAGQVEAAEMGAMLLGAVAGYLRRVDDTTNDEGSSCGSTEQARLEAICHYIERHLADNDLDADHLCARFHCSRATLFRLFAPLGGVATHIRKARLRRCYHDLATPRPGGERIIDVALRWGFSNSSHFSRLFRQTFGITPLEAMARAHRPEGAPTGDAAQSGEEGALPAVHGWLKMI